uniref:Uncharacterized protein n=1 Tax=Arundo donax TaxID=35708 RepID=A0A0A9D4F4_ARUDO
MNMDLQLRWCGTRSPETSLAFQPSPCRLGTTGSGSPWGCSSSAGRGRRRRCCTSPTPCRRPAPRTAGSPRCASTSSGKTSSGVMWKEDSVFQSLQLV